MEPSLSSAPVPSTSIAAPYKESWSRDFRSDFATNVVDGCCRASNPAPEPNRNQWSCRSPAALVADALALDFLNTVATPLDDMIDILDSGEGLLTWLGQAKLVPANVLDRLRTEVRPGVLDDVATEARQLREWFRTFVLERKGRALTHEDLKAAEPLNRILERDDTYTALVVHADGGASPLKLQTVRRCRSPDALLMPIAELLARFMCEQNLADVRLCEGPWSDAASRTSPTAISSS